MKTRQLSVSTHCSATAVLAMIAGSASAQPFPAVLELSSLSGADGFVLNGAATYDTSGFSCSSVGDVNGDGIDDVIIGAINASPNGVTEAGQCYVVFGAVDMGTTGVGTGGSFELAALDGSNGFTINGINTNDSIGTSVSSAGDLNGDGFDDLVIGAWPADTVGANKAGQTYVVFGAPGLGASGTLELSSLNGPNGVVFNGIDNYDASGGSPTSPGDLNGDGIDDLVIGAWSAAPVGVDPGTGGDFEEVGEAYVIFGATDMGTTGLGAGGSVDLASLSGPDGFVINGVGQYGRFGFSNSAAGDINGDGLDDLIVGAYNSFQGTAYEAGETYVIFGATDLGTTGFGAGGSADASSLNGPNGFSLRGIDQYDKSGCSVSGAGDVNGDGLDDVIIGARAGAPNGISYAGESYVVFGATDLGTTGVGSGGGFDLSTLNGTNGFVINGNEQWAESGDVVSSAGDVNDDGFDDLMINARSGNANTGATYVIFGGADLGTTGVGAGGSFELSALDGANGFTLNGIDNDDLSGHDVSSAGDVNADGITDLIIGARFADPNGLDKAGESYIVFGRGSEAPCPADLNGDGILDNGDIGTFVALFLAGDLASDLNGDGILDNGDIGAFVAAFLAGC